MKLELITGDSKGLIRKVRSFAGHLSKLNTEMHVLCVSVLNHAAVHRDTRPLNSFYAALPVNLQTSLRQYLGRTFKQHPNCEFLTFSKDEFHTVDTGPDTRFAKVCTDKLLNPDGEYRRFYERDNVKESVLLNDVSLLTSLKAKLAKAKGDTSQVSGAVVVSLEEYIAKLTKLSSTLEKQDTKAEPKTPNTKRVAKAVTL